MSNDINQSLMKKALLGNVVFSMLCSADLLFFSDQLATLMGALPAIIYQVIGVTVLLFALSVLFVATRPSINRVFAIWIVVADWCWVALTFALLPLFAHWFSTVGIILVAAVAIAVGGFAWVETRALNIKSSAYA